MTDIFNSQISSVILLFVGTVMVCVGSFMHQKAWHRNIDAPEVFMASMLIGFSWIVVSSVVLSYFNALNLTYRFIADAIFLASAMISFAKYYPTRRRYERDMGPIGSPAIKFILLLGIIIGVVVWVWAWITPPPAWDAFVYHLSFPAAWLRHGKIFPVTVPFGDQAGTYFPSNVELIYLWILTYAGQDFATNVPQWFFMIACMCSVYRLSRLANVSRAISVSVAFGVLFMPSIVHQAASAEVDIAFSALFMISLYFVLRWSEEPGTRGNLLFSFLALGLFVGTKTIALPWSVFILFPIGVYMMIARGLRPWMIAGPFLALLTGSYWYLRNFLLTGNPIFPLSINIGGFELFPGAYTRETMLNSIFHTDSFTVWFNLLAHDWGIVFLTLVPAATIYTIFRPSLKDKYRIIFGLAPWAILMMSLVLVPYNQEVRFTYTAFLTGLVSLSIAVSAASEKSESYILYVLPAIFIMNLVFFRFNPPLYHAQIALQIKNLITAPHPIYELMQPSALFLTASGLLAATAVSISTIKQKWIPGTNFLFLASFIFIFIGAVLLSQNYPKYQYDYYAATPMGTSWRYLHGAIPQPIRVAYSGTDLSYGLYGPGLKNAVYHVPINMHGFKSFHHCNSYLKDTGQYEIPETDRIDFCRRDADYSTWFNTLIETETDILFVSVLHQNDRPHLEHDAQGFPIEKIWAEAHPANFEPLPINKHSNMVRMYRVIY